MGHHGALLEVDAVKRMERLLSSTSMLHGKLATTHNKIKTYAKGTQMLKHQYGKFGETACILLPAEQQQYLSPTRVPDSGTLIIGMRSVRLRAVLLESVSPLVLYLFYQFNSPFHSCGLGGQAFEQE